MNNITRIIGKLLGVFIKWLIIATAITLTAKQWVLKINKE